MTVMELQFGYILGQERIITTHNGTYGWRAGCSLVQVHRFNSSGVLVSDVDAYPTTIPGATVVSSLPSGNVVVLERLPITLRSASINSVFKFLDLFKNLCMARVGSLLNKGLTCVFDSKSQDEGRKGKYH
jgi:hypothetical protein